MKINPCLIFLLLFTRLAFAQGENDRKVYFDSLWKETEADDYTYYRIMKDYKLTKSEYAVTDYYRSGKLQMTGSFTDRDGNIKTGEFIWYYENGNKKTQTTYKPGKTGKFYYPVGASADWYENGNKKTEGEFTVTETPEKTSWRYSLTNYWDPKNVQQVTGGNGIFTDDEDKFYRESGQVKNGYREGTWQGTGISKKKGFVFTDEYKEGDFISGVLTDSVGVKHPYEKISMPPKPKKGLDHFYKFVSKKFRFSKETENASGKIVVEFTIDKTGDATNFKVVQSAGEALDAEVIRVISAYPDWEIGRYRGMDSKARFTIPVTVKSQ